MHDVLRQGHAGHAGITDVVDVGTGHLTHQRDLADGRHVRALLRGADSRQCQLAAAVHDSISLCAYSCVMPGTVPVPAAE